MRTTKRIAIWLCLVMLAALAMRADEWNKKTIVTFNAPVEIPGKVLLPGTYTFQLLDTQADRSIVQIFDKDGKLAATIIAVPDYSLTAPEQPIIKFEQLAKDAPPAIRAWFYPGDNYGYEFVYPKTRATELAAANHKNVPAMADAMTAETTKPAKTKAAASVVALQQSHITAMTPEKSEVDVGQAIQTKAAGSGGKQ
jgi:hypothetical protein